MAGRFVFSPPTGFPAVRLGVGVATIFPSAVDGDFNIEVFTAATASGTPPLDPGVQDELVDKNGSLVEPGFLTGNELRLGSGSYAVADYGSLVGGSSPADLPGR